MIQPLNRKKPYSRGSQPFLINSWLEGDATPRGVRPKYNFPHEGVMMPEGVYSLESRGDRLFSYGHMIARRSPEGGILLGFVVPDHAVAIIARKVGRFARVRGVRIVSVGPNGSHLQACLMRLKAVEKTARRQRLTEEFSASWRLSNAATELATVAENPEVDRERLIAVLDRLKGHVTRGRLLGWGESRCRSVMDKLMIAQHAIEMHMEVAA
jgi:hypothetical protein